MSNPVDSGDTFGVFFADHKDAILRAASVSIGDPGLAEECCAEAFARAWERWDSLASHPRPQAWVVRTAININIDGQRRRSRHTKLLPRLALPDHVSEPPLPIDPDLWTALLALPERQRQVVALRVVLGLSAPEAATELDISVGSVATHLHRALASLRTALPGDDPSPEPRSTARTRS